MLFLLFIFFRALVVLSLVIQDRRKAASEHDTRNTNIPTRRQANKV